VHGRNFCLGKKCQEQVRIDCDGSTEGGKVIGIEAMKGEREECARKKGVLKRKKSWRSKGAA